MRSKSPMVFADLNIRTNPETDRDARTTTARLSDRFGLTLYDTSCLELAQRIGLPLASLDNQLRQAGAEAGIGRHPRSGAEAGSGRHPRS